MKTFKEGASALIHSRQKGTEKRHQLVKQIDDECKTKYGNDKETLAKLLAVVHNIRVEVASYDYQVPSFIQKAILEINNILVEHSRQ